MTISCDEIEKIEYYLANHINEILENHFLAVPSKILPSTLIHSAMDNFDSFGNNKSGVPWHGTILMIHQNNETPSKVNKIGPKHLKTQENKTPENSAKRILPNISDCQKQL